MKHIQVISIIIQIILGGSIGSHSMDADIGSHLIDTACSVNQVNVFSLYLDAGKWNLVGIDQCGYVKQVL